VFKWRPLFCFPVRNIEYRFCRQIIFASGTRSILWWELNAELALMVDDEGPNPLVFYVKIEILTMSHSVVSEIGTGWF
jgi:hypothetical protein